STGIADSIQIEQTLKAAHNTTIAHDDDQGMSLLTAKMKMGLPEVVARDVIETCLREEDHAPRSVWDFVQAMTAVARKIPHQDKRLAAEEKASKLLELV